MPSGAGAAARARRRQRGSSSASSAEQREHDAGRHEVDGEVEPVRAGGRASTAGPYSSDQRALDLRLGEPRVDQALDERPLTVGLRRLGDVQRDFAGDAHHLAFHGGQRGAGRHGPAASGGRRDGVERHGEHDQPSARRPVVGYGAHPRVRGWTPSWRARGLVPRGGAQRVGPERAHALSARRRAFCDERRFDLAARIGGDVPGGVDQEALGQLGGAVEPAIFAAGRRAGSGR